MGNILIVPRFILPKVKILTCNTKNPFMEERSIFAMIEHKIGEKSGAWEI